MQRKRLAHKAEIFDLSFIYFFWSRNVFGRLKEKKSIGSILCDHYEKKNVGHPEELVVHEYRVY